MGIICARVSTRRQIHHLQTQIDILKQQYPEHMIIKDVGSCLEFKRKGPLQILELVLAGQVQEICSTHKDHLCRFAYYFIQHIFNGSGTKICMDSYYQSANKSTSSDANQSELTEDMLSILTVSRAEFHCGSNHAKKEEKSIHK